MIPPEVRVTLRRLWFDGLAAEIARRLAMHTESADQARQQVLAELQQMGERLVTVSIPEHVEHPSPTAIVEELIQANGDWARIDAVRPGGGAPGGVCPCEQSVAPGLSRGAGAWRQAEVERERAARAERAEAAARPARLRVVHHRPCRLRGLRQEQSNPG